MAPLYSNARISHRLSWTRELVDILVDGNMYTRIPYPFQYNGRDVQIGNVRYETWSPNVEYIASYAGLRPTRLDLQDYFGYRLLDGSCGRFDPGFYPQTLTDSTIHFAFFPRRPIVDDQTLLSHFPEWLPLTSFWAPESNDGSRGRIQDVFLDSLRRQCLAMEESRRRQANELRAAGIRVEADYCSRPLGTDVDFYKAKISWEAAVDGIAVIQLLLKQKRGFFYYYRALNMPHRYDATTTTTCSDPKFMGGYVNNLSQANLNLLLRNSIPVFCIHQYIETVDYGQGVLDRRNQHDASTFIQDVDFSFTDSFDQLVNSNAEFVNVITQRPPPPPNPRTLSGSWMQGHVRAVADAFNRPLSPPNSIHSGFDSDESDIVMIPPERDLPSVTPPRIAFAPNTPGHWQTWTDAPWDCDDPPDSMRQLGRNSSKQHTDDADHIWYDRQLKRVLLFSHLNEDYRFGHSEWGQPFPRRLQFPPNVQPSTWMYLSRAPKDGWGGMVFGREPSPAMPPRSTDRRMRRQRRPELPRNQPSDTARPVPEENVRLSGWDCHVRDTDTPTETPDLSGLVTDSGGGWGPSSFEINSGWGPAASSTGWGSTGSSNEWGVASSPPTNGWGASSSDNGDNGGGWGVIETQLVSIADGNAILTSTNDGETGKSNVGEVASDKGKSVIEHDRDIRAQEHITYSERAGIILPSQMVPFERMSADPFIGSSSSSANSQMLRAIPHTADNPNVRLVPLPSTAAPTTSCESHPSETTTRNGTSQKGACSTRRRTYTEEDISLEVRQKLDKNTIRRAVRRMNRLQRGIETNLADVDPEAQTFASNGIYIPPRQRQPRRARRNQHVVNINLRLNLRAGGRHEILVNLDNPTHIAVSVNRSTSSDIMQPSADVHPQPILPGDAEMSADDVSPA